MFSMKKGGVRCEKKKEEEKKEAVKDEVRYITTVKTTSFTRTDYLSVT